MPLNIAAIQYSLDTYTLEIYTAGCNPPHCPGCHNEELWSFDGGLPVDMWEKSMRDYARAYNQTHNKFPSLIENIWLLGGEPLDNDEAEVVALVGLIKSIFTDAKLWLFTRREINSVPDSVKSLCDYVKTGAYVAGLTTKEVVINGNTITLASCNQDVHEVKGVHVMEKINA